MNIRFSLLLIIATFDFVTFEVTDDTKNKNILQLITL